MTQEQLFTANKLAKQIEELSEQRERWEKSVRVIEFCTSTNEQSNSTNYQLYLKTDFLNFDVVKGLALSQINKRLLELEKQLVDL